MYVTLRRALALSLLLLAGNVRVGMGQVPVYEAALALEATARWDSAAALLAANIERLTPPQREHAGRLDATRAALAAADLYERAGRPDTALVVIQALQLDAREDVHLVLAQLERIESLRAAAWARRDEDAGRRIAGAAEYADNGDFEAALAIYDGIIATPAGFHSDSILEAARDGRDATVRRQTGLPYRASQFVLVETGEFARQLLGILFYIALAWLFVHAFRAVQRIRRARPGTALDVQDLTAPEADRERASRVLAQEIHRELRRLSRQGDLSSDDRVKDLEGFAHVRPDFAVEEDVSALITDDAIQIGIIKLNPRQIAQLLARTMRRPYEYTLQGYLNGDDSPAVTRTVTLEKTRWRSYADDEAGSGTRSRGAQGSGARNAQPTLDRGTRAPEPSYWNATATGERARTVAIRELVLHYVFDHAGLKPTSSWESFWDYHRALQMLAEVEEGADEQEDDAQAKREALLRRACATLQVSLRRDPSNWMARFKLAEVLRRHGERDLAIRHFGRLENLIHRSPWKRPASLNEYLRRNPDFPTIVAYNRAVTHAMQLDLASQDEALRIIGDLLEGLEREGRGSAEPDGRKGDGSLDSRPAKRSVRPERLSTERVEVGVRSRAGGAGGVAASATDAARTGEAPGGTPFSSRPGSRDPAAPARGGSQRGVVRLLEDVAENVPLTISRIGSAGSSRSAETAVGASSRESAASAGPLRRLASVSGTLGGAGRELARRLTSGRPWAPSPEEAEVDGPDAAPEDSRTERLRILLLSARASALASRLEVLLDTHGHQARNSDDYRKAAREIKRIEKTFREMTVATGREDGEYELAFAVVQNATGRVFHLDGDYRNALTHFNDARARMPDMIDPYIGIASALLKDRRGARRGDRRDQIRELLEKALELDPYNGKAHYHMARLEMEEANYEEAKLHLKQAAPHPWALFQHAKILVEQDEDSRGAIQLLQRSIRILPRPDYRSEFLIKCILGLGRREPLSQALVKEATQLANRLTSNAAEPGTRRRGEELRAEIKALAAPPLGDRNGGEGGGGAPVIDDGVDGGSAETEVGARATAPEEEKDGALVGQ